MGNSRDKRMGQSAIMSSTELFMQTGNVWDIGDLNKNLNQSVVHLMLM